jgi:hypothetical protein
VNNELCTWHPRRSRRRGFPICEPLPTLTSKFAYFDHLIRYPHPSNTCKRPISAGVRSSTPHIRPNFGAESHFPSSNRHLVPQAGGK